MMIGITPCEVLPLSMSTTYEGGLTDFVDWKKIACSRNPSVPTFRPVPDDGYFDQEVAESYDDPEWDMMSPEKVNPVVDFLVEQCRGGDAMEFGIGTGRIALPLAQRGVQVSGIDISRPMVDQMLAKPGGEEIDVAIGDFATTRIPGEFSLVFLVFNTIMNLTAQSEQVACFRNAADHLATGGRFVIEVGVPDLRRLPPGQTSIVFRSDDTGWDIDDYDVANQGLISHHLDLVDGDIKRFSVPFRYVWPSELDLMAEMAGMRIVTRHAGWDREPFTGESREHVSVWEKL
jgi:SAM-dependent methyltransferase